ncbi:MAG: hypothetical protein ACR2K2_14040 [Mycobacteriales bacterium]
MLAVLLAVGLSGCGAGMSALTYQERRMGDATNTEVGSLALRNVSVLAPEDGSVHEVGDSATATVTITNRAEEADRLISVTTAAAQEVALLSAGEPDLPGIPGRGSTQDEVTLVLKNLTEPLHTGEYISMSFRFERNGTVAVLVPIAVTGSTDRPVYTGGANGEEGEPALQAPTGGHGDEQPVE